MQKNNKKNYKKVGEIASLTNRQQKIFYFYAMYEKRSYCIFIG